MAYLVNLTTGKVIKFSSAERAREGMTKPWTSEGLYAVIDDRSEVYRVTREIHVERETIDS